MPHDRYREIYDAFHWQVPQRFNIAAACCRRWASEPGRVALYYEDDAGKTATYTYAALQAQANRLSNAFAALGIKRGDRVADHSAAVPRDRDRAPWLLSVRRHCDAPVGIVRARCARISAAGQRSRHRVATVRRKHDIAAPVAAELDPDILNLAQAQRYSSVSDTTIMRLIKAKLLKVAQAAPYAPLEIKRIDLDSEPVAGILAHLRATGRLILDGDSSAQQTSLF